MTVRLANVYLRLLQRLHSIPGSIAYGADAWARCRNESADSQRLIPTLLFGIDTVAENSREKPRADAAATTISTAPISKWVTFARSVASIRGHSSAQKWIRLGDGGHFENLGLYELVARQCMDIIVVDATYDPQYGFVDFASSIAKCNEDFGARIEIPGLLPCDDKATLANPVLSGSVYYPEVATPGRLIYIKSAVCAQHSLELRLRSTIDRWFPHEPTSNQFSTIPFVKAYFELGYESAKLAFPRKTEASGSGDCAGAHKAAGTSVADVALALY